MENPLTGGSSTEQIVVLSSSEEHSAGIGNISVNHYKKLEEQRDDNDALLKDYMKLPLNKRDQTSIKLMEYILNNQVITPGIDFQTGDFSEVDDFSLFSLYTKNAIHNKFILFVTGRYYECSPIQGN